MKLTRYSILSLILLSALLTTVPQYSYAQQTGKIDKTRMNRDLDIMDGILEKLYSSNDANSHFYMGNRVSGSYLPDYGVMFRVPSNLIWSPLVFRVRRIREQTKQNQERIKQEQEHLKQEQEHLRDQLEQMKNGTKKNGSDTATPPALAAALPAIKAQAVNIAIQGDTSYAGLSKKEIINRAVTFLSDYAGAIGQLTPDDHIMIEIERKSDNMNPFVDRIVIPGSGTTSNSSVKDIYISLRKSDITAHRTGKLSDSAFRNRIMVGDGSVNPQQSRQFDIMANILGSAFKDSGPGQIHTSGSVSYSYVSDYGVIYYMNAGYFGPINSVVYAMAGSDAVTAGNAKSGNQNSSANQTIDTIRKAYDAFLTDVRETLVDYGPTLRVLRPTQRLVLTISFNNQSYAHIPGRVTFRVSGKTLVDYNAQRISRNQAMNDIRVTEYD